MRATSGVSLNWNNLSVSSISYIYRVIKPTLAMAGPGMITIIDSKHVNWYTNTLHAAAAVLLLMK